MPRTEAVVAEIVARRPFAVLGYSAEDATWCPACLRSAACLSPGRSDTCGQPILPLYARDATVREELCEHCGRPLYELLAASEKASEEKPVSATVRTHGSRSALEFAHIPPLDVRSALKATGWRWDPRLRVWWSGDEVPPVPARVVVETASAVPRVAPKPPIIHRRA